jgi:hypothetical protein
MKNRRKYILPYIGAVFIAVFLIIAAGAALAGCVQIGAGGIDIIKPPDTGVDVGGPVPGDSSAKIPVAHFNAADGTNAAFTITWDGKAAGDTDDQIVPELQKFLAQWDAYTALFNSLPRASDGTYLNVVTQNGVLALDNPTMGKVILKRWWPKDQTLTHTAWIAPAGYTQRVAGFRAATTAIQAVMDELKGSPYHGKVFSGERISPLTTAVDKMEAFIVAPNTGNSRTNFEYLLPAWETAGTPDLPAGTGHLYEVYFGYVPKRTEYVNPNPDLMAYPE